ncbi:bilin-binding protein-like [Microplitis demolitor]|uniref:bilin-binding protein-like n=1 Tax=Microplitis demolitor TaxID=69319 RepID=UPI0004CCF5DD|nr:bilin-binding protein-like [Microplitis demolitor]
MFVIFYFLTFIAGTLAQISRPGSCPYVKPVENFQPENYTGVWYEIKRYDNFYELNHKCTCVNVTLESHNRLKLAARYMNSLSGSISNSLAMAYPIKGISIPQYRVKSSKSADPHNSVTTILDTDYTNYSIVYMCQEVESTHLIYLWIFSRERTLSLKTLGQRLKVEADNHLPIEYLQLVEQNCS